jgi:hypothetical protein
MPKIFKARGETTLIPIFGGLGNQLFQYAFALSQLRSPESRVILIDSSGRIKVSRKFDLMGLSDISKPKIFSVHLPVLSILFGKLVHKYLTLPVNKQKFLEKFRIYKEGNLPLNLSGVCIGQFQDSVCVGEVSQVLNVNYSEFLKTYISKKSFERDYKYVVIHLRRGDYLKDAHGYLSRDYYLSILKDSNSEDSHIIVHTDDVAAAEDLGRHVNISEIIGPEDAEPWDVIIDMTGAEFVICANSTLSWWGGWFCIQKGGKAYIPKPWFKNLNSGSALGHPGFFSVSSIWE